MKASANPDNMGKLFVTLFAPPGLGLASPSSLRSVRRGVYPAKRDSSTFAPAPKTNL